MNTNSRDSLSQWIWSTSKVLRAQFEGVRIACFGVGPLPTIYLMELPGEGIVLDPCQTQNHSSCAGRLQCRFLSFCCIVWRGPSLKGVGFDLQSTWQTTGSSDLNTRWLCLCKWLQARLSRKLRGVTAASYPVESEGGRDGHASDMGVVPSDDTSSWVMGWCSKNLETSSKLQTRI